MANKIHNIFESGFDSFELDDSFLLEVDADLKKNSFNVRNDDEKLNCKILKKPNEVQKGNKNCLKKTQLENLSLFLEDLNESDFFDQRCKSKKNFAKFSNDTPVEETKTETSSNSVGCCSSPVLRPKPKNILNKSFSSTPLKLIYTSEKGKKEKENILKSPDCVYLEADLFDDWNPVVSSENDSVTLSQAFKLIEEAELAKESDEKDLNASIDLLTGEAVGSEVGDLFDESFNVPKSSEKNLKKDNLNDCLIILEDSVNEKKESPAHNLYFGSKRDEKEYFNLCLNSDDDFDFLTQKRVSRPKKFTKWIDCSSDESSENVQKKGKHYRVIVSDSDKDSSDCESERKIKKQFSKEKYIKKNTARRFILSEAEVSDIVMVSSDESEKEVDYDASFVDEELYLTQNISADMTAKYLESVKNSCRPGQFKIPEPKPYNPQYILSQIPEDNNTEYELDSFCVNDEEEEEVKTDLSDLEIAEQILEMDRKKRKRKRRFQRQME